MLEKGKKAELATGKIDGDTIMSGTLPVMAGVMVPSAPNLERDVEMPLVGAPTATTPVIATNITPTTIGAPVLNPAPAVVSNPSINTPTSTASAA